MIALSIVWAVIDTIVSKGVHTTSWLGVLSSFIVGYCKPIGSEEEPNLHDTK